MPVFTFSGKKKTLTPFGQALAKELSIQFDLIAHSVEKAQKSFNDLSTQAIRIGGRLGALKKISPLLEFPGTVIVKEMDSNEVVNSILQNEIEYGISRRVPDSLEIISKKIAALPIHLVAHKSLFKTKKYFEEFTKETLWKSSPLYTYSNEIPYLSDWCKKKKVKLSELEPKFILSDWEVVLNMAAKNKGYTFCPAPSENLDKNLISVPIDAADSLELYLLYSKATKQLFPLEQCFNIEQLKKLQGHKSL